MGELRLTGVTARHGERDVLVELSMAVAPGEVLTVVGPSGSGKTTLLRTVAGLHPVACGAIEVGGRDVTALPPAERDVSMVFQAGGLFPHLDVTGNIGFGLAVRGVARRDALERVRATAALVGCEALLDRRPDQLSGGERQRVALARALVRSPEVLLLDEPLSSLDAPARARLRSELVAVRSVAPTTTVHVTHDQVEALTLGDRVAVLHEGRIQQVGRPTELWWRPANRFVATFLGSPPMNVLAATVLDGRWCAGPLAVAVAEVPGVATIEVGARPEHVELVAASHDGAEPARVERVEVAGADAWVTLRCAGGSMVATVPSLSAPAVGDAVGAAVDPARCLAFDAASGETLRFPTPEGAGAGDHR